MSEKKSKDEWEMTIDVMMIVGKYLESNNDYINLMKICKRYHDLVEMYHYNLIGDCELFENMETQHFYHKKDFAMKKEGMVQYIYWYNDDEIRKNVQENEVIKPMNYPYKYVTNNKKTLEEWCGYEYDKVLYDSDIDGKEQETMITKS